jgi:GLPGLI family protein
MKPTNLTTVSFWLNLIAFILAMLSGPVVSGQEMEGEIWYKETIRLDIDLPPEIEEQMKGMFPSEQSSEKALYFTKQESLYKDENPEDDEQSFENESEGGNIKIKMVVANADNRLYSHFQEEKVIEQKDFLGKKFLIKAKPKAYRWKMTGEQKKVLEYICTRAEYQDSTGVVEAWFTPQLPLPLGPAGYGQLPGAILEVNMNDGERVITATSVELKELPDNAIEIPNKGKKVSRSEFEKIVAEKKKEMNAEGGAGMIKVRIRD